MAAAVLLTASVAISPNKDAYEIAGVPLFITLTSAGILLSIWGIALDFRGRKPPLFAVVLIIYNAFAVMLLPLVMDRAVL